MSDAAAAPADPAADGGAPAPDAAPANTPDKTPDKASDPAATDPKKAADPAKDGGADDWMAGLSPDGEKLVKAKGWTKPGEVIDAYAGLEKRIGMDRLPAPKPDALDSYEHWDELGKALGVPDEPGGYDIETPQMPEGMAFDDKLLDRIKGAAHMMKVPPYAVQAFTDEVVRHASETFEAAQAAVNETAEQTTAALKKAWGAEYDANIAAANQTLRTYGLDQQGGFEQLEKVLGSEGAIRLLADAAALNAEDRHAAGVRGAGAAMTPERAHQRIAERRQDEQFMRAYNDRTHSGHKTAVEEMSKLYAAAEGRQTA